MTDINHVPLYMYVHIQTSCFNLFEPDVEEIVLQFNIHVHVLKFKPRYFITFYKLKLTVERMFIVTYKLTTKNTLHCQMYQQVTELSNSQCEIPCSFFHDSLPKNVCFKGQNFLKFMFTGMASHVVFWS